MCITILRGHVHRDNHDRLVFVLRRAAWISSRLPSNPQWDVAIPYMMEAVALLALPLFVMLWLKQKACRATSLAGSSASLGFVALASPCEAPQAFVASLPRRQ